MYLFYFRIKHTFIVFSMGYPGLEPETSPLSGARSTTELIAHSIEWSI